jgi:GH15 family glucan-1,4-alpha-glucosidase
MGRPVMLSNGQLMVGLDENGLVHDFYYPYVGLENLTTAHSVQHKIGVWINGIFSWVDDGSWKISLDFESDALVSNINFSSSKLGIVIHSKDFVDSEHNAFIRRIEISNNNNYKCDVRLFLHQVFQISRAGRADTALYVPDDNYILDYKGRYALLIHARTTDNEQFDQYAIGNYGIEGKTGTFVDAEDGELSGNPVEHGGVDSVIRVKMEIDANSKKSVDYWIIASSSQYDSEEIHNQYLQKGIQSIEDRTRAYWFKWFDIGRTQLKKIDSKYLESTKKSMMVINAHTDRRGGILASGDSSIFNYGRDYYCYCWPRDGAYAIWPLIRLGYTEEPKIFFEFCRDTMDKKGYMRHKYQPDRSIGSTWHPLVHDNHKELAIQEDETAILICMLSEYYDYSKDLDFVESLFTTLIKPAADFLANYIDEETNLPHASYDLWEEKFLTTTYTCAVVEHALNRASRFADLFDFPDDAVFWQNVALKMSEASELLYDPDEKFYRKGFHVGYDGSLEFDNTLDSSSPYGIFMFKNSSKVKEMLESTISHVENKLQNKSAVGGIVRYSGDKYMTEANSDHSNPWFVCTLWLAQYYIEIKKSDKAKEIIDWAIKYTYSSGVMSEQINPNNGEPAGVAPLVWSHSEFINTVLDLTDENTQH